MGSKRCQLLTTLEVATALQEKMYVFAPKLISGKCANFSHHVHSHLYTRRHLAFDPPLSVVETYAHLATLSATMTQTAQHGYGMHVKHMSMRYGCALVPSLSLVAISPCADTKYNNERHATTELFHAKALFPPGILKWCVTLVGREPFFDRFNIASYLRS